MYRSNIRDILFKEIDCEKLEEYAEDYLYRLNTLSKESYVRKWGIVVGLKTSIDNFKTVLPLIDSLRKPYIRARHWQ